MMVDFNECIKSGVEQAMKECELTIGMTLKECVEKQIPKKVAIEDSGYDLHKNVNVYECVCKSCNDVLFVFNDDELSADCDGSMPEDFYKSFDIETITEVQAYCGKCGQRLDWSVEE